MVNYVKITDFAVKDSLLTGNPLKLITGTAHDNEYNAISVAIASKVDETGGTLTNGTLVNPALGTPASGTLTNCTGLPLSGVIDSTTEVLGVGSLELGHATDTTLTRSSAGVLSVEGVNVLTTATGAALAGSASQTFSVAAATAAAHAVRLDQIGGDAMQSGTFTATGTGFATPPTATVTYKIMNGMCFLNIPQSSISGTSNATTFTITGIPAAVQPSVIRYSQILLGSNNGATISNIYANISGGTITLGVNGDPNAWAAANNKGLYTTTITYML